MPDAAQPQDRLLVLVRASDAFVRVQGRGSFKVSSDLKDFGRAAAGRGARRLVLDMTDCASMDSTFMGVTAGLALHYRRQGGEVWMVNLSDRTRQLLATLGLDHLIQAVMAGQTPPDLVLPDDAIRSLEAVGTAVPATQAGTARVMLEAHETLVEVNPDNLAKFKDVLTYLKEDLDKSGGGSGSTE